MRAEPHACRPSYAHPSTMRRARESWEAQRAKNLTVVKKRPACPRTVLGLAQQRVALMCGPGSGAPIGVQKGGCVFVPLYMCTGSRSRAYGHTKQNRGGDPG